MGDKRNRLLGLDEMASNEAKYERLRWPVLPLLDPMASENSGALSGELMRILEGYGKSETLDEESERTSPSTSRFLRISSSSLGSIESSVRSSQPCLVLNCARARRFCNRRAIWRRRTVSMLHDPSWGGARRYAHLAHFGSFKNTVHHFLGLFLPRRRHDLLLMMRPRSLQLVLN